MIKSKIQSSMTLLGHCAHPAHTEVRQLQPTAADFTLEPIVGVYKTVRDSCSHKNGFSIAVRTQIQSKSSISIPDGDVKTASQLSNNGAKIVKLSRSLQRGEVITLDDLVLVSRPDHRLVGYFEKLDHVIGRKTNRPLSVNPAVRHRHLEMAWAVEKDQTVTI